MEKDMNVRRGKIFYPTKFEDSSKVIVCEKRGDNVMFQTFGDNGVPTFPVHNWSVADFKDTYGEQKE